MKATTEKTKDGFKPVVKIHEGVKLKINETFKFENVAVKVAEEKLEELKQDGE